MVKTGERHYRVDLQIDSERRPYTPIHQPGPFLTVRVSSGDSRHPEITAKTYLECQIGSQSLPGNSRFHLVHNPAPDHILFHNIYKQSNLSRDCYDPKITIALVMGPRGLLGLSLHQAFSDRAVDGEIVFESSDKNNATGKRIAADAQAVLKLALRELKLSNLDSADDLNILAAGNGVSIKCAKQDGVPELEVEIIRFPAIIHRSERPLISSSSFTVQELLDEKNKHPEHETGIRGLSNRDLVKFEELLALESFIPKGDVDKTQEGPAKKSNGENLKQRFFRRYAPTRSAR